MVERCKIREIAERHTRMLEVKPARGMLTCTTTARLIDGLRCEIAEGPWRLTADMPRKVGGDETAPAPGVLGRGALASCLVIGISTWAARLGVPIDALEVEVEADFDARGELGVGQGIRPGYTEIRYRVAIDSKAARDDLAEVLELAERHSPYLDVFGGTVTLNRMVQLNGAGA